MEGQVPQMLWALNSLLIIILGFMIRNWVQGVTKKVDCKQDKTVCKERYPSLKANMDALFRHKHQLHERSDTTGGVVIP